MRLKCLLTLVLILTIAVQSLQEESGFLNSTISRLCRDADRPCSSLPALCLKCTTSTRRNSHHWPDCTYGSKDELELTCRVRTGVKCKGDPSSPISRLSPCLYCWQLSNAPCIHPTNCSSISPNPVTTVCYAPYEQHCLGSRTWRKQVKCNWTHGYKWTTAFALSVTLGGFGVDRFYLGHWREGLGKLFSFGGLGLWTFVDIVLIGIGYIGPEDGSIYM